MLKFCSIASGSSGNCYVVASEDTRLLLDAGISGKRITAGLESIEIDPNGIDGILVTHEHIDHVKGVGILSRKYNLPIYANEKTWRSMRDSLGKLDENNIKYFATGERFAINDIEVKSYPIPHDAIDPVGFSFYKKDKQLSVATDLGYMTQDIYQEIMHADLLVLEANHDIEMLKMGRYPWPLKQRILSENGHLSNVATGEVLCNMMKEHKKERQIILAHLSNENNFPEMAFQTVKNALEEDNIMVGKDIFVETAHRSEVGMVYSIRTNTEDYCCQV